MSNLQSLAKSATKNSSPWKFSPAAAFAAFASLLIASAAVLAADAGTGATNGAPKITGPLKRVGSVELDPATKTVIATGFVEQIWGVLDYLAVGINGKRYESVLTLELNATDLQTAMLLCGSKSGEVMKHREDGPPNGSSVKIWVEWKTNNVKVVVPAETLIWNKRENKPIETDWTFTGSFVSQGRFAAADDESLVAVRWDPYAIVNISNSIGRTYADVFVNTNAVPDSNTPVRVYFQSR